MCPNQQMRGAMCVLLFTLGLVFPAGALGQQKRKAKVVPKAPESAVFNEALARARENSQPLIVIGTTTTCSRCAAFKQGLESSAELKELMAQYVSIEVTFAGPDFVAMYHNIINQDGKYGQSIGGPSVFLFTSQGAAVYAGPNTAGGMVAGDEFKQLLIKGIEANRSALEPKRPAPAAEPTIAAPPQPAPAAARTWKSKSGQFTVSAALVGFDGARVQLRRADDGKTISVNLEALSAEDQQFLKASKR